MARTVAGVLRFTYVALVLAAIACAVFTGITISTTDNSVSVQEPGKDDVTIHGTIRRCDMVLVIVSALSVIASAFFWQRAGRAQDVDWLRLFFVHTIALASMGACFIGGSLAKSTNVPFYVDWIDILSLVFGWVAVAIIGAGCFFAYRAYIALKLSLMPMLPTSGQSATSSPNAKTAGHMG